MRLQENFFPENSWSSSEEVQHSTSPRSLSHRPVVLVCGARPEERALLLRQFPMWDFRFGAYQGMGELYTDIASSPEASLILMAKRHLEGPEMITFLCQCGMPYYLFENKSDLNQAGWCQQSCWK